MNPLQIKALKYAQSSLARCHPRAHCVKPKKPLRLLVRLETAALCAEDVGEKEVGFPDKMSSLGGGSSSWPATVLDRPDSTNLAPSSYHPSSTESDGMDGMAGRLPFKLKLPPPDLKLPPRDGDDKSAA
mmetsp:Transcript_37239/g.87312  ORF Transcript_37239/g.87312 Transcript_37239/m.87312 type:complete len:129 (-) Transcript_37239:2624-3010(-)